MDELSRAMGGLDCVVFWALEGTCMLGALDRRKRREATLWWVEWLGGSDILFNLHLSDAERPGLTSSSSGASRLATSGMVGSRLAGDERACSSRAPRFVGVVLALLPLLRSWCAREDARSPTVGKLFSEDGESCSDKRRGRPVGDG